jgi:hypothetical protein
VDRRAVLIAVEAFGLIATRMRTGRDDELVVRQQRTVDHHDFAVGCFDEIDLADDQFDAVGDERCGRPYNLVGLVGTERDEEIPGLIVVLGLGIHDGDLPVRWIEATSELVDGDRAGGARAENEESFHTSMVRPLSSMADRDVGPAFRHRPEDQLL